MSDGDRENGKDRQIRSKNSQLSTHGDEFGLTLTKVAVAQICRSAGFHGSHRSAINALAEVAVRYICELGKSAKFYANLSGRTCCNVFDIIQGLEDLSSSRGFSGISDVHHCLVRSGIVREIAQFVITEEEVPFRRHIPKFPIPRILKPTTSFAQVGETSIEKHIPDWLPRLPDPHTYAHPPVLEKGSAEGKADMMEQARQRRKIERSFLSLEKKLAYNSTAARRPINVGKGKQVGASNPFLAPPFPHGEKVVSEIACPWEGDAGKKLSVREASIPGIEAAKVGSPHFNSDEKKILPRSRPTIHFKLGADKKSITASFSSDALDDKSDTSILNDDDKDEKKRTTEMVLKEAMEKPHDLAPL
ncbi:transcription initiation factor TFIID subunit 8-like isoform X1 [Canna indica]|uniref:Transcription initiation factor TFIID subunit 8 n=1 Tax=Canna indica TaxID=4628 RepID=A0AAQ3QMZ8_9LILI|nr:transcription initiation factor TFIID subunit 8-like isoform X1 [Canna indica]